MNTQRICIYPKDIQRITGKSERFGRKIIQQIKQHLNKEQHQFITINEFAEYTGIDEEIVTKYLND